MNTSRIAIFTDGRMAHVLPQTLKKVPYIKCTFTQTHCIIYNYTTTYEYMNFMKWFNARLQFQSNMASIIQVNWFLNILVIFIALELLSTGNVCFNSFQRGKLHSNHTSFTTSLESAPMPPL